MRWTNLLAALIIALFVLLPTAAAEGVQLKDSWTILQPGNNVDIHIDQTFSVERLRVESTYTVIDRANFSAAGSTSDKITVNLSWFNKTADLREYAANFTAETADGNNANFSLTLTPGADYGIHRTAPRSRT